MKWLVLLLGLLLFSGDLSARAYADFDHKVGLKVFTVDDGLPQSGVNDVVQARDGYLWVGTFGGLARFDGSTFTVFRRRAGPSSAHANEQRSAAPASDRIVTLLEDDEGRLWVGTENAGLSVRDEMGFRHLAACESGCQINRILQGADGAIWAASSVGLFKLRAADGKEEWAERSSQTGYTHLASDSRGTVFVGGAGGLHVVAGRELRTIPLPHPDRSVRLLERDGDKLLVGTERELYRFDPIARTWQTLGVKEPAFATRDAEGLWWVSQASRKVVRENGQGAWQEVPELSALGVSNLTRDAEGNLWASSGNNGLIRVRKPLFGLASASQLGTDMAGRAIVSDGHGGLWLGSACGGLFHWPRHGEVLGLPIRHVLGSTCVTSLLLDRAGTLWIGTADGGLGRIAGGKLEPVRSWPSREPVLVWQRGDGAYIVGVGRSTYVMNVDAPGRAGDLQRIEVLQGMRINSVVAAMKGGDWFVGDDGVLRLIDGRVAERWSVGEGLSSRFARALHEDATGAVWVGTYGGGLNRIERGVVHHYDSRNGLVDETVSCIQADSRGRLWLGGNMGVTLLPSPGKAAASIESVRYAARDGLIPAEINGGGSTPCHRDARGRLWFSLVAGFGVIDPTQVPDARPIPLKAYIEHAAASGDALDISAPVLKLPPFSRNLEIRYTAINLGRPQETRFRFRLSGVNDGWVEAGPNRSILYPSIPWGAHEFEVQARVAGAPWSSVPGAKLKLVHPQPWYQRPWIWTLITLLGLLVLVASSMAERNKDGDDASP